MKLVSISMICIIALATIFSSLIFSGCFSTTRNIQARAIDANATNESVDDLSDAMNDFSFQLYSHLGIGSDKNIFFSPYSIFVALAMTYEGARGDTAKQMKHVLGFEQNNEISLCSFGRIYNLLNIDTEYTLNTANALWTQQKYPFLEEYLNFIDHYYMGKTTGIDFTNSSNAAEIINEWVEKNTGGKIKDMLSSNDISPGTVLILSNAIYFKGLWLTPFNVKNTSDRDFYIASESKIQVSTMVLIDSKKNFNYAETEDLQILELPYKGNTVSMVILLPKENNIDSVEEKLDGKHFSDWLYSMHETDVNIYLPKFTFKTEYNLKETLIDIGLDIPFSFDANFSGMNGFGDLFIDKVLHKAFVEVNEEGTEAGAATTVHVMPTASPEPTKIFNADHPFIFLIQHKETGTILFIGKVTNPK